MYQGIARNKREMELAIALAISTFRSENETSEESLEIKGLLLSPCRTLTETDVIVLVSKSDEIYGACFLVDRELYRHRRTLKGTFLTSICIAESYRGRGFSKLLLNEAILECERRGSIFAILIARRAVDYFYNQFLFWGLSQYSKLTLSLPKSNFSNIEFQINPASEADIIDINTIYQNTYENLYGSFVRTTEYWRYILWKTKIQQLNFSVFKTKERIIGYLISKENEIFELAAAPGFNLIDFLYEFQVRNSVNLFNLHVSERHPIVQELSNIDFSIIKRQCKFGGHMVRVINHKKLMQYLMEEINEEIIRFGINNYKENFNGIQIEVREGNLNATIVGSPFNFENTSLLFGATTLSSACNFNTIFKSQSFNVQLLDQI